MRFSDNCVSAVIRFAAKAVVTFTVAFSVASTSFAASSSKHAAVVIDANTGKILYSDNADQPRHPASLTKMMTLYMLFEAMERGKISKSSKIVMSKRAANMAPTKLGVKAGNSITVETAILALVTKSANDAAAASAEFLGGSESRFAEMMTAKARSIGMKGTRFYNASGLPDLRQITTARDMATLGIALREHFPQYYGYFSTRSFTFGRSRMANHNKLLGRVAGVDGIKTGYTRMSGFNLVSSVAIGNKKIVAVVLGGRSGGSRDAEMAGLISKHMPKASSGKGGALVAMRRLFQAEPAGEEMAAVEDITIALAEKPKVAIPAERPEDEVASLTPKSTKIKIVPLTEDIESNADAVDPITTASAPEEDPVAEANFAESGNAPKGSWVIQIAAADSESGAMKILKGAKSKGGEALAMAEPFTQSVQKGSTTLYRARFGGFESKTAAWNACEALKRKNFGCFALTN